METDAGRKDGRAMKLWLISQEQNRGYDTYDSAVVAAETEQEAIRIIPGELNIWGEDGKLMLAWPNGKTEIDRWPSWAKDLQEVECRLLGEACEGTTRGLIIASFNAG